MKTFSSHLPSEGLMKKSTLFTLFALLFLVPTSQLFAAGTVRWTGGTSTEWSTSTNWTILTGTPSRPPSSADTVVMGGAAITNQPSITSTTGSTTIRALTFESSNTVTLTFVAGSTGALT